MDNNIDIKKDVVSFQQAIDLCVIGFNDKTLCAYEIENQELYLCHLDEDGLYMPDKDISAPFKSQVFRWFREKYDLFFDVYPVAITAATTSGSRYKWDVYNNSFIEGDTEIIGYLTYEEAENDCIDKLIEIAKQR